MCTFIAWPVNMSHELVKDAHTIFSDLLANRVMVDKFNLYQDKYYNVQELSSVGVIFLDRAE